MTKVNRRGFVYGSLLLMSGIALGAFMPDGCIPWKRRPVQQEAVRGDGVCQFEHEGYPFLRNKDGTVKKDEKGNPVRNPNYSKEDCFRNDNVPDLAKVPSELKDPAGNSATLLGPDGKPTSDVIWTKDGKIVQTFRLPLEDENSIDAIRQTIKEQPCVKDGAPLTRKRITFDGITGPEITQKRLRQRSQAEVEYIHLHPETLKPGDNYYVVLDLYHETCYDKLQVCTPDMVTACFCPNHPDCIPKKEEPPPARTPPRRRPPRVAPVGETPSPAPVEGVERCKGEITAQFQARANVLRGRHLTLVRETVGEGAADRLLIGKVSFQVRNGKAKVTSITVEGKPMSSDLVSYEGIPAGVDKCDGANTVKIPPG